MAAQFPPPGSTDCHVHVIGPKARFPLAKKRTYTPMDATTAQLAAMLRRLGLDRVVLVQPSFYGTDNACMIDCMAALPGSRGVAVLPAEVPGSELDDLHKAGVRGLRVNIATGGTASVDQMRVDIAAAAKLCARNGWHVQIFVPASVLAPLSATLRALPVDTVIDHFGLIAPEKPGDAADTLVAPNPERAVWGSDWPHTPRHDVRKPGEAEELPFQDIDTKGLLALVPRWLGDDALVKRVLVDNPARLYGF